MNTNTSHNPCSMGSNISYNFPNAFNHGYCHNYPSWCMLIAERLLIEFIDGSFPEMFSALSKSRISIINAHFALLFSPEDGCTHQ